MSRSYKRTVGFCDRNPFSKKYANRRVRRLAIEKTLASGRAYAKHTNPWDICDWRLLYFSMAEFRAEMTAWWEWAVSRGYKPEIDMTCEEYIHSKLIEYRRK